MRNIKQFEKTVFISTWSSRDGGRIRRNNRGMRRQCTAPFTVKQIYFRYSFIVDFYLC